MKLGLVGPRARLLLGILALLAPIGAWQYVKPAVLKFASGGGGLSRVSGVQLRPVPRQEIVLLQLAALAARGGEYEPDRNIFVFGQKPRPAPPPPPPPPPRARTVPRTTGPPPPPPEPQPPPLDVSLIGVFGPERRRIAVLADSEGAVINALEQEVVREKFIVHRIGYESVDFTFVGFPDAEPKRIEIGG